MDLLEKQDYPTRLEYPGGPPDTPYDLAGWTLPMQTGITVDRIDTSFNASTEDNLRTCGCRAGQRRRPGWLRIYFHGEVQCPR
ncbi:MAG: hypothetical protein U5K69_05895 [Balneolaceae bacterium]|nr:hypothetical protein [Balneolaceae bacterium]